MQDLLIKFSMIEGSSGRALGPSTLIKAPVLRMQEEEKATLSDWICMVTEERHMLNIK
ncbi:hypothetical protein RHGRI_007454 [Rhododendron griersonianum]|uniref:Uncharacterized protein n=1 Tax=Rhododendron griersonianum TaxID=479676 RepID=A0AAV6KWU0_9ERIC|nr:hypothetical protein RHGRI_007454 [Rhododendron griersonianum]